MFPVLLFVANNKSKLKINSDVYSISTGYKFNFYKSLSNLYKNEYKNESILLHKGV
jgi:hypothetical protein